MQNQIFMNNGSGYFTLTFSSSQKDSYSYIAVADLDNDGDEDYISHGCDYTRIYLNDGSGSFSSKILVRPTEFSDHNLYFKIYQINNLTIFNC